MTIGVDLHRIINDALEERLRPIYDRIQALETIGVISRDEVESLVTDLRERLNGIDPTPAMVVEELENPDIDITAPVEIVESTENAIGDVTDEIEAVVSDAIEPLQETVDEALDTLAEIADEAVETVTEDIPNEIDDIIDEPLEDIPTPNRANMWMRNPFRRDS